MILLIDNYDSFVFNLARYLERLGQETQVIRNDAIDVDGIRELSPDAIVLSPGPCTPTEAGSSLEVVRSLWREIPMLGICLGHQTLAAAFGATIVRANEPVHGRTSRIFHDGRGVFRDAPSPLTVCRYHSLVVEPTSLPVCFEISARTADDTVMAIRHREHVVVGVQFHPESILTEAGFLLLENFLDLACLPNTTELSGHRELLERTEAVSIPDAPVTF